MLGKVLEKKNYRIFEAQTIPEASEKLNQGIDCILLDLKLPDGNEINFLKKINSTFPVIILTGCASLENEKD